MSVVVVVLRGVYEPYRLPQSLPKSIGVRMRSDSDNIVIEGVIWGIELNELW